MVGVVVVAVALVQLACATEKAVLKYVEMVAVVAAVGRGSVSSRWRFTMHSVSFESRKELGN